MIKVYHNQNFLTYSMTKSLEQILLGLVATVKTDDLEEAFRLTNNIDDIWTKNPEVTSHTSRPRSTSVGDVMLKDLNCLGGAWYVVESLGFRQLTEEEASKLSFLKG